MHSILILNINNNNKIIIMEIKSNSQSFRDLPQRNPYDNYKLWEI